MYQAYLLGGSNDGLWEDVEEGTRHLDLQVAGSISPYYTKSSATEVAKEVYADTGAQFEFKIFAVGGSDWTAATALAEVERRQVADARRMTESNLLQTYGKIKDGVALTPLEKAVLEEMELRGIQP
jgi:hypothetical protein